MAIERWMPRNRLSRLDPLTELEEFGHTFGDIFQRPPWPSLLFRRIPLEEKGWAPPLEVFDKDDKLVVKAELPGMKEEDIDVSVEGDMLTLKGERKAEKEVKDDDYYCCERSYGSFFRSLSLPSHIDATKIEANYENGILEIAIPKVSEAKPKKVKVLSKAGGKNSK